MLIPAFRPRQAATATFIGATSNNAGLSTYTFTDHAIGAASIDRIVVVCAAGNNGGSSVSSVTIGGVTATILAQAGVNQFGCIAALAVPAGTTATIVVALAAGADRCRIAVYTIAGTRGVLTAHHAITSTADAGGGAVSVALNVPSNGAIIGLAYFRDTTAGLTGATWSGLTENDDAVVETANHIFTVASLSNQPAQTGKTISVNTNLDNDTGRALVAVSWRPS